MADEHISFAISRRHFLFTGAALGMAGALSAAAKSPALTTRGVVILDSDADSWPWIERAATERLTTIGIHLDPAKRQAYVKSDKGRRFLSDCADRGLNVEYEAHAMHCLLPRDLFSKNPDMFRMNDDGVRVADANLCVHSEDALKVVCENAAHDAFICRPATHRYFFWIDDACPMCRCPKCRGLSDCDQAVLLENEMLKALRKVDPAATLAHLAYVNTLNPPKDVKPDPGLFLEFAPINRRYDKSVKDPAVPEHVKIVEALDHNLGTFDPATAQILEYWLDVSFFARWKREQLAEIPWNKTVFAEDIAFYSGRGIRNITTFAVWLDNDYVRKFGEPPLHEYAKELL